MLGMSKVKAGQVAKGAFVKLNGDPCQITGTSFHHHSRGGGYCNFTYKNLAKDGTHRLTCKSSDQLEVLDVSSEKHQFLYSDNDELVVMHPDSFEQRSLPASLVGRRQRRLLTPDTKLFVLFDEDRPIGVSLPPKLVLTVTQAHHEDAGNTVGGAKKMVTLETGYRLQVPLFIKQGDQIVVDTESGQYVSRFS
ncbi:MAG: hypothetical protein COU69_02650 [Candidatus Pacebacteria bacterium CG10_big_fil_rev_8_21_14_0_10_56_10]|nr:MAG: hypothetical protein COU69_02650 [Candidatus Pacebacteria bacterium CG10_big_fil_rev_8_21_14_0_10_56_10]